MPVVLILLYAELSLLLVHLFESALTLLVGHRLLCLACCAHGLAYGCRGLVGIACRQSGGYALYCQLGCSGAYTPS